MRFICYRTIDLSPDSPFDLFIAEENHQSVGYALVELMDGEIGVESEPGRGSTFWFRIPFGLADDNDSELAATETRDIPEALHGRVLLAEDNPTNQMISRVMLTKLVSNAGSRMNPSNRLRWAMVLQPPGQGVLQLPHLTDKPRPSRLLMPCGKAILPIA